MKKTEKLKKEKQLESTYDKKETADTLNINKSDVSRHIRKAQENGDLPKKVA